MSAISGISGGSGAWQATASGRASQMRDEMFAKVDGDGNGSVDKSELQGMLDHVSSKSGTSPGSADELLGKMDSDGNGSLSKSELEKGMESLRPASTMAFAQQRTGAGKSMDAGSSTTTSSATIDPLDTNEDGVVSAQERLIGKLEELVKAVKTGASDGAGGNDTASATATTAASATDDQALASFAAKITQRYLDWASQSSQQSLSVAA